MRYLILSDLHSNQEALEAVLSEAGNRYERILCCGDVVGYGADPGAAVEFSRARCELVVRGNHDKACAGLEDLEWFNPVARISAQWTLAALSEADLEYLRGLPQGPLECDGYVLVHGSPVDEDDYVLSVLDAIHVRDYLSAPVTFFGHTHVQGGFQSSYRGTVSIPRVGRDANEAVYQLEPDSLYMVNPGSVGQPRDRDPRAAYALYDSDSRMLTLCRADYDIGAAQEKIRQVGLPEYNALRLETGQ